MPRIRRRSVIAVVLSCVHFWTEASDVLLADTLALASSAYEGDGDVVLMIDGFDADEQIWQIVRALLEPASFKLIQVGFDRNSSLLDPCNYSLFVRLGGTVSDAVREVSLHSEEHCLRKKMRLGVLFDEGEEETEPQDRHKTVVTFAVATRAGVVTSLHEWHGERRSKVCDTSHLVGCSVFNVPGSRVRLTYDQWSTIFRGTGNGDFDGLMYHAAKMIADRLDLTLEWEPNEEPGKWGAKGDNGSWYGMVRMVADGRVDVGGVGFVTSPMRGEVVDFSLPVFDIDYQLFMQRPSGEQQAVSTQNYWWEFDRYSWASIAGTGAALALGFAAVLTVLGQDKVAQRSSALVLRGLLYKGFSLRFSNLSWKVLLMVNLLFATVINVSYRSCMNAFLTVVIPVLEVKDLSDVVATDRRVTFWAGGSTEHTFASGKRGSPEYDLYQVFKDDETAHVLDYGDGLDNVRMDDRYVMVGPRQIMPEYGCDILRVPDYTMDSHRVSFVFEQNGRFRRAFDKEILRMKQQGVVDRLRQVHFLRRHEGDCKRDAIGGAVSLGFANVFTPFALLAGGVALGLAAATAERATRFLGSVDLSRPSSEQLYEMQDTRASLILQEARAIMDSPKFDDATKVALLKKRI